MFIFGRRLMTFLLLLVCARSHGLDSRPNVVLILADDLGSGDVQALNPDSDIPTPNFNQLAADGLTFLDAHSPSAVCTPTRYGLLTGRYCWRSKLKRGVLNGYSPPLLEEDQLTIGTMLQKAGYQTAIVGKWHLGMEMPMHAKPPQDRFRGDPGVDFEGFITDSPREHGFEESFLISASLDMAPYVTIRNGRFTAIPAFQQPAVRFPHYVREGPRAEDFVIEEILDKLVEESQVRIREFATNTESPFFLYIPLTGPHKPTQPAARFQGKTSLGGYGDFVHQVDWSVGSILQTLRDAGVDDDTLVIVTSDNGSYMKPLESNQRDHVQDASVQGFRVDRHRSNHNYRGTKADIWEAGHRVPMFVKWPSKIRPGKTTDATVCLTDILATIAQLTDCSVPAGAAEDSCSFASLVAGGQHVRPKPVIHHSASGMFSIRSGDWKLILGNGSGGREAPRGKPFQRPFQLYNLENDITESSDVASGHPAVVTRLENEFEDLWGHPIP